MHDGGTITWRDVVEKHHSALVDELTVRLDSDFRTAISQAVDAERSQTTEQIERACDEALRAQSEILNQTLRRLRQGASETQILELLNEGCGVCSERSVVLVFENNQARCAASRGVGALLPSAIAFDIAAAPALVSAIETRDPIVALASDSEISPVLAKAFAGERDGAAAADAKVYLFPVIARHSVIGMLIASGAVSAPPIELMCEAAGMKLEVLRPVQHQPAPSQPAANPSEFVPLASVVPAPVVLMSERRLWDELSTEERQLHLKAQRMARVRVAEMRLYQSEAVRQGATSGDIYGALRSGIDAARSEFLQTFLKKSPTMVDYLHLEMLRNLAQDDDRLLGPEYPGPMV
jgi:hypothetical protein